MGLVVRLTLLLVAFACTSSESTVEAPPTGECTSTTREDVVTSYADVVTWFDAQGRRFRQTRDAYLADGTWLGSSVSEHGYVGELLMSHTVESDTPEGSSRERTLYEYDEEGRRIGEEVWRDDTLLYTRIYRYDALGQAIGGEQIDHLGGLDTVTERWWSEGRVDGWETRGPDDQVMFYADYDYLFPAPALDAEILGSPYGWQRERYDGERRIELEVLGEGPWSGHTWQWVWRSDGQVALERRIEDGVVTLTSNAYDDGGRLVRVAWGVDVDGDDGIDEGLRVQTWDWSCD